jgi:hypothetical protein
MLPKERRSPRLVGYFSVIDQLALKGNCSQLDFLRQGWLLCCDRE